MNTLPTFPERFVNDFWEPTRKQMEPIKARRDEILRVANKRASEALGFQVDVKRRTLYGYLGEV